MKTLDTDLLAEMTRRLVDEFHPEQIILFGSYAWGTPNDAAILTLLLSCRTVICHRHNVRRAHIGHYAVFVSSQPILLSEHAPTLSGIATSMLPLRARYLSAGKFLYG